MLIHFNGHRDVPYFRRCRIVFCLNTKQSVSISSEVNLHVKFYGEKWLSWRSVLRLITIL